jgi:S-layer homology domain
MNRSFSLYALSLALTLGPVACSKADNASSSASPAAATPTAVSQPSAARLATAPATAAAALTDIAGVNGEKEIDELAGLAVVDPVSGAFDPGAPVKRRDFIRWLVKANNALWSDTPGKLVKLADKTEASSFPDVSTSDPDFPYVQGMQDAGYSVGFPDKTFKPDQALTREQMFAIKNVFDRGSVDSGLAKDVVYARNTAMPPWKDKQAISKTYVAAIATGADGGNDSFSRVYGTSSFFHPQLAVTRAQAAVAVSVVGDHIFYGSGQRSAAQPPPTPTP